MTKKTGDYDDCYPDRLAGYADGELSTSERTQVEEWLVDHPEAKAELELQRSWSRKNPYWLKVTPPSPSDSSWNRVLGGIRNGLEPASTTVDYRTPTQPRRSTWLRWSAGLTAVAAALAIALHLAPNPAVDPIMVVKVDESEALPIVVAAEVDILSLQGDDASLLLVGQPPLGGPIVLVGIGDVALDAIMTEPDGRPAKATILVGSDLKKPIFVPNDKTTQPVP